MLILIIAYANYLKFVPLIIISYLNTRYVISACEDKYAIWLVQGICLQQDRENQASRKKRFF